MDEILVKSFTPTLFLIKGIIKRIFLLHVEIVKEKCMMYDVFSNIQEWMDVRGERLKMGEMLQNINLRKGVLLTPTHVTFLSLWGM
jgi:hypothetical protein